MVKPSTRPADSSLSRLIHNYLICKESITIEVTKIVTRRKIVTVDVSDSWKEYIL